MLLFMEIFIGLSLIYFGSFTAIFAIREAVAKRRQRKRLKKMYGNRWRQSDYILRHINVIDGTCYYKD